MNQPHDQADYVVSIVDKMNETELSDTLKNNFKNCSTLKGNKTNKARHTNISFLVLTFREHNLAVIHFVRNAWSYNLQRRSTCERYFGTYKYDVCAYAGNSTRFYTLRM